MNSAQLFFFFNIDKDKIMFFFCFRFRFMSWRNTRLKHGEVIVYSFKDKYVYVLL